jgi:hypothetical protein
LVVKNIVTDDEPEEFTKFVSAHNIHTAIIGWDGTDTTRHLISGNGNMQTFVTIKGALRTGLCDIAIQCGEDLGQITKILVVFGDHPNDDVAFQFVANILASHKAEVTILNVSKNKEETALINLQKLNDSLNKYLGSRTIVQGFYRFFKRFLKLRNSSRCC